MYLFAKLNKDSQEFVTRLTNSGTSRKKLVSYCIGKAIADELPMCAQAQTDIRQFFRLTLEMNVSRTLSAINELIVIDPLVVIEYVRNIYIWRYRIAFDPPMAMCSNKDTVTADFLSFSQYVDRDTIATTEEDFFTAMRVYNSARSLYRDLRSTEVPA